MESFGEKHHVNQLKNNNNNTIDRYYAAESSKNLKVKLGDHVLRRPKKDIFYKTPSMLQRRSNSTKLIQNGNIDLPVLSSPIGFSPKASPFFNFLLSRTYDQQRGPWPEDRPLPLPVWSDTAKSSYYFTNILEFEALALVVENKVQHLLEEHNYNSITNFLKLYLDFKRSGETNLAEFFQKRTPEITDEHLTCVGLALELRKRISGLENKYPGLTECMYLVSCEEHVDNAESYINTEIDMWEYSVEKEHVMLALKVDIGGRKGMILCDPGYHIARIIIVMEDESYPHTGRSTKLKANPFLINYIVSKRH